MARQSRNLVLLSILIQTMFGLSLAVQEWQKISDEEHLEMENQLKIINKTPIKSFKTDHGDILDCIEIYKQHAFDHPLLKDHKIQKRPKNIPKSSIKGKYPKLLPKNMKCPPGTVMIKRTTKEDLIIAKKIKDLKLNLPTNSQSRNDPTPAPTGRQDSYALADAQYSKHNFGAKTMCNVWNPSMPSPGQASWAFLWVANGPDEEVNVVQVGWGVDPSYFSSNFTRLIAYWTADAYRKTGCVNYNCPGFVQVHKSLSLGLVLDQISAFNGTQTEIEIALISDGEWWLKYFNQFIGYWPQKLFYFLYGGANYVLWGGQVYSTPNKPNPPMGSGHHPEEGREGISAYFKDTQIWDSVNFVYPDEDKLMMYKPRPDCYDAELVVGVTRGSWDLFYGGPSNQCTAKSKRNVH